MTANAEELVAQAALWQWAARSLWYPDAALLADLAARSTWRDLAQLGVGMVSPAVVTALARLRRAARALSQASLTLAEEHTFLFARQVLVPPHGTAYAAGADRTHALAKIGASYAAFGFQVSDVRRELPDHVSVELEFIAALLVKEAYAVSQDWQDRATVSREARRSFLEEHLGRWLPLFAERLGQHARLAFYPSAAALSLALLPDLPAGLSAGGAGA